VIKKARVSNYHAFWNLNSRFLAIIIVSLELREDNAVLQTEQRNERAECRGQLHPRHRVDPTQMLNSGKAVSQVESILCPKSEKVSVDIQASRKLVCR
jgi:hypothetical protein